MKRTQWTALFADIRKTIVSFVSIALFVALGIGVFLGIKWNEPAIAETSKQYYNAHSYHDLSLTFPYGVTEDDLAKVKALDGVSDAEGSYSAHGQAYVGDERYVLVIKSLTERIDTADILEGTLPSAKNEIGIERMFADDTGLKVGDKLTIDTSKDESSYLYETEFTITAIVEHPSYIRNDNTYTRGICDIGDGTVDFYVLTSKDSFNIDTYDNCFSELLVRGVGFDELTPFSEEYDKCVAELSAKIEGLGLDCAQNRTNSVYNDAMDKISDAEEQISDAEAELESGKAKIENAESEIAENERLLAEAQDKYESGLAEYEEKNAELNDAHLTLLNSLSDAGFSTDLDTAVVEINEKLSELESLKAQATDALEMLDIASDYLEKYKEDPDSVDIDELSVLLASLAEFILNDPDSLSQIETTINDAEELITKYIENSAELTEEERKTVEDLLLKAENEVSTDSASRLLEKINTVRGILEMCRENPDAVTPENISEMIQLAMMMGYKPDLDEADALLSDKKAELNSQISEIEEGQSSLREALDGIEKYKSGASQIEKARAELLSASIEILDGKKKISDAKTELADAKEKLAEGEKELSEKRAELNDAKKDMEGFIHHESWTVQKRSDNPGYAAAKKCAVSSTKLCFSMAILFVFVGLMVCYTSVSRNVHESQVATGVQKALGFRRKEITAHYMLYSVLAVGVGILSGCLLGYFVIETIVNQAYQRLFVFSTIVNVFRIPDALVISAVEMALILLATWLSCSKLLKKPAIELLRGETGSLGRTHFYEKTKRWGKLSLYTQSTINNLVNDKPRVIATLVGVAGCTALVVAGMSLQLSLANTPEKHFEDIWTFDARLVSDSSVEGAQKNLCSVLDDEGVGYTSVRQEAIFIKDTDGKLLKADLIVPETQSGLLGFVNLKDHKTNKPLNIPEDGVIISRSYEKHHDIHVGDTVNLLDMNGVSHESKVVAVSEHYLSGCQLVMSRSCYESMMSKESVSNTIFLNYGESNPTEVQEKLSQTDGYFSLTDEHAKWVGIFAAALKSTTLVVYICLFLSAVMALLVLLNLNVVAISEKKRELIIMRINGFSIGETKKYVYRDNIILTAIGILLGIGIGIGISIWMLNVLQGESDNFLTDPNLIACLTGAGLSIVFAIITNMIALRKIEKFKVYDLDRQ
ncbi:MAG: FtsX-like permease family protein [Eubacteriales bacterium]